MPNGLGFSHAAERISDTELKSPQNRVFTQKMVFTHRQNRGHESRDTIATKKPPGFSHEPRISNRVFTRASMRENPGSKFGIFARLFFLNPVPSRICGFSRGAGRPAILRGGPANLAGSPGPGSSFFGRSSRPFLSFPDFPAQTNSVF